MNGHKKERVRLNGDSILTKPKRSKRSMAKVHKARDKARRRYDKKYGKKVSSPAYKALLEVYENREEAGLSNDGKIITKQKTKDVIPLGNLPLFLKRPLLREEMINSIRDGMPFGTVCKLVGITTQSFKNWMKMGIAEVNEEYTQFYIDVVKAEAEAEVTLVQKLQKHQDEYWQAVAWQLERRWPENWSKKDYATLRLEGEVTVNHKSEIAKKVVDDPKALDAARTLLEGDEFGYAVADS